MANLAWGQVYGLKKSRLQIVRGTFGKCPEGKHAKHMSENISQTAGHPACKNHFFEYQLM